MSVLSGRQRDQPQALELAGREGRKPPVTESTAFQPARNLKGFCISAVGRDTAVQQTGRCPQPRTWGPARRAPSYLQAGGSGASPIQQSQRNREAVAGASPRVDIPALIRESRILAQATPSSGGLALWEA